MWTSGVAILRDLSRAQGGGAHAELRALRPRDRPPPPPPLRRLSEETEEYVRALAPAPAACDRGPDLRHIQLMLDMVRKLNIAEKEIANDEALIGEVDSYAIERSSSTSLCAAEPGAAPPGGDTPPARRGAPAAHTPPAARDPYKHNKRRRNIALESILALANNERSDATKCTSEPLSQVSAGGLRTTCTGNMNTSSVGPTHKEHPEPGAAHGTTDSNAKVNHWIDQMTSPIQTNSRSKRVVDETIRLHPLSMFKKRVKVECAKPGAESRSAAALDNEQRRAAAGAGPAPYEPPAAAYQRYLQDNQLVQKRREEASHLAVLIAKATERAALEASERAAIEEGSERAAREASERAMGCVGESAAVLRGRAAAPASARLAAPRACAPRAPCPVCERLTRRARSPATIQPR